MNQDFDKVFWEQHWQRGAHHVSHPIPANPHLIREISHLSPGSALEAGCGSGAEAIWLATMGWSVSAVDISRAALELMATRATAANASDAIRIIEADLTRWTPATGFDLVTSHYAHATMPQLDFYDRIARWVNPGGTLLLVGHLLIADPAHHEHQHPTEASVTAATISQRLDTADWTIETAREEERVVFGREGQEITLHDVVVRATRQH